jgi:hypothetical protein
MTMDLWQWSWQMDRRKTPISANTRLSQTNYGDSLNVKRNFSISATNDLAGILRKVKPVMESVLLLPPHTNSDLRYCNEEIMQSVDDFLYTSEQHFIIPFFVFVLDELDHLP